LAVFIWSKFQ